MINPQLRRIIPAAAIAALSSATLIGCSSTHHTAAKTTKPSTTSASSNPSPAASPSRSARTATHPSAKAPKSTKTAARKTPTKHPKAPGLQYTKPPAKKVPKAPKTSLAPGAEGINGKTLGQCKISSSTDVATAFGGKVDSSTATTSGTGNPICQFTLTNSRIGPPGVVSMSMTSSATTATFRQSQKEARGAAAVAGLGDRAFYIPAGGSLQFLSGHTMVAVQASLRVPGSAQPNPAELRADLLELAKKIVADL